MKLPRWMLRSALLAAFATALTSPLAAQGVTTGAIGGTVTNEQGQPVEAVQVQVTNRNTGFSATVTTRSNGRYLVPGLEVGSNYSVTVRRIGYAPMTRQSVTVSLSQTAEVNFVLQQQAAQLEAVTVTAETDALISPTRTGVATTVSDSALRRLPTLNRNFTDFVALTPQVSTSGPGLSGGGTNNRYNSIQIDGASETDLFGLGSTGQPGGQANGKSIGIESVKEYQVLLTPFDVRQGNFSGVLVNAVTKSGTNEFHGSAYGVTRNEKLARDVPFVGNYDQTQYGFSAGGPIVRNKAFFFVNPEWQTRSVPASGIYLGQAGVNLTSSVVDAFRTALAKYGFADLGSAGLVNNTNPLTNIFGRLDFNLPGNTQLVLRHNYGKAQDDNFSRSPFSFRLGNNGYAFTSNKNATVAQLRTLFGGGMFNEFFAGFTTIRDRRAPNAGRMPQISVKTPGYTLVAGAERFSQGNELDQDITELQDNLTIPFGSHQVTVGGQAQFYKVRNQFTQASYGVWTFSSLDSLNNGIAEQYIIGVPLSGDGAVRFKASSFAGYLQDAWTVNDRLNVTLGLRLDAPVFNDKPPANPSVLADFGRRTEDVPSGNIQWSPRLGFNWDVTGDQVNQLRGGVGLFAGRPAFVWLSNAFQNSGSVGVGLLTCGRTQGVPAFNSTNIATPPPACTNGQNAAAGGEIDLLDPNLKFPQNLRATLGFDRRIGDHWVATLEGLVTKGVNGLFYQNIALGAPLGTDKFGRVIYGNRPFRPNLAVPGGRNVVLDVTNQSKDRAYNLTAGLQRRFADRFEGSLFYTYSRAWDVQSLTSSTAYSQYRYGRTWAGNQSDVVATRSMFEQPHRIVAQGSYSFPTRTTVSVVYFGESGTPYGYVVSGDANGDNFSENDPIYVPNDVNNPAEIKWAATRSYGGTAYTGAQMAAAFDKFIEGADCLREARGTILGRNACDNPFTNKVNVSLRQALPTFRGQNVSLQLDVFNFGNLLNRKWGTSPYAGFGSQALLDLVTPSISSGDLRTDVPTFGFNPGYEKLRSNSIFSVYQLQLQARLSF